MHATVNKTLPILLLFVIVVASWGYSLTQFFAYKEAIALWLEDFIAAAVLRYRVIKLSREPADDELLVSVDGVAVENIANTWGDARSGGRTHEGTDIFAERGTPVYAATDGYVLRTGDNTLGGIYVFTIGAGGVRYYYAHLNEIADDIEAGEKVTTETVIGYVGDTGNARDGSPHLHFGMYTNRGPQNHFAFLADRS